MLCELVLLFWNDAVKKCFPPEEPKFNSVHFWATGCDKNAKKEFL